MTDAERVDTTIGDAVRATRRERRLSTRQLAGLAGISQPTLSNIENGRIRAGVSTLYLLAEALGVPPARFLSDGDDAHRGHDDASTDGAHLRALPVGPDAHLEVYEVSIPPGGGEDDAFQHSGEDALFVIAGRGTLALGARTVPLQAGDVVRFDATASHRLTAAPDEALVAQVITVRAD